MAGKVRDLAPIQKEFLLHYLNEECPETYMKPMESAKRAGYGSPMRAYHVRKLLEDRRIVEAVSRHFIDQGLNSNAVIGKLLDIINDAASSNKDRLEAIKMLIKLKILTMPMAVAPTKLAKQADPKMSKMTPAAATRPDVTETVDFKDVQASGKTAAAMFEVPTEAPDSGVGAKKKDVAV